MICEIVDVRISVSRGSAAILEFTVRLENPRTGETKYLPVFHAIDLYDRIKPHLSAEVEP